MNTTNEINQAVKWVTRILEMMLPLTYSGLRIGRGVGLGWGEGTCTFGLGTRDGSLAPGV